MTIDEKLKKFQIAFEEKLAQGKLNLGFAIVPGRRENTIRLEIFDKKRLPTQYGRTQGAHTVAFSAVLKSLVWLLEDVTDVEARARLVDFHWDLYATYVLCVNSTLKPSYLDTLKQLADSVHGEMRAEAKERKAVSHLMTDYLTLFLYIHNLFPDAAINLRTTNRGESFALKNLKSLDLRSANSIKDKANAIASLSRLIDEEAVIESLRRSHNMGGS